MLRHISAAAMKLQVVMLRQLRDESLIRLRFRSPADCG